MKKSYLTAAVVSCAMMLWNCGDNSASNADQGTSFGLESSAAVNTDDNQNSTLSSSFGAQVSSSVSSSAADVPGSSAMVPGSSAGPVAGSCSSVVPGSSADPVAGSSADPVPGSSNSDPVSPELGPDGFPTIESYGMPSPEYTKDISATAKRGWNTRYWDACKPHCSWLRESSNDVTRADTSSNEAYAAELMTARNCNIHDVEIPTFTLGNVSKSWMGYEGTNSACGDAKTDGAFTCTDMAPIAVNDTLSYAYVAGTADGKCGKCYHLQYDGHFKDEFENNPPKATTRPSRESTWW